MKVVHLIRPRFARPPSPRGEGYRHLIRPRFARPPSPRGEGFGGRFNETKKKKQKDTPSFCLRPYPRDSLPPRAAAVGCPFGVRAGPHFPKCRPDPILLPESFCVPLRLRVLRGLSRTHPSTLIQFFRSGISSSGPKKYEFSLWISYKVSITSPSGKVKRKRKNSAFPPPEPVGKGRRGPERAEAAAGRRKAAPA